MFAVRHTARRMPALCRGLMVKMEPTPNPDSMKFIPEGHVVLPEHFGAGLVRRRVSAAAVRAVCV